MIKDFIITTDSTADLYPGFYEENPTDKMFFPYSINGNDYDGVEGDLTLPEYYKLIEKGCLLKTSQINQYTAELFFEKLLKEGNNVMHISFSSGMSSSFDNISVVVKNLQKKYPNQKIEIIDSLCGAGGEGLLVYYAIKQKKEGKSYEEIQDWLNKNKLNAHHIFIVNDLKNLRNSGRISNVAALVGMVLNVKPVLELSKEGKIKPIAKIIGRRKAIAKMIESFKENYKEEMNDFILIGHTFTNDAEAIELGKTISKETTKEIKYCVVNRLVGGHAGLNSLVVYFMGKTRN